MAIPLSIIQTGKVTACCRIAVACRVVLIAKNNTACGNMTFGTIQLNLVITTAGCHGCTITVDVNLFRRISIITKSDIIIQVNFIVFINGNILTGLSFRSLSLALSNIVHVTDVSTVVVVFLTFHTCIIVIAKTTTYVLDYSIACINAIFVDGNTGIFNSNLVSSNAFFVNNCVAGCNRPFLTKIYIVFQAYL